MASFHTFSPAVAPYACVFEVFGITRELGALAGSVLALASGTFPSTAVKTNRS
jgi:hypothetical protein